MNKKVIYGTIFTLSLVFGGLNFTPAHAEETVTGHIELDDDVDATSAENTPVATSDDTEITPNEYDTMPISETELEEGTSGEPEVVCADESEPDCNTSDPTPEIVEEDGETETIDPELWPLILSLSSLGATIILVIIINVFGRKK